MDDVRKYSKKELKALPPGTVLMNYGSLYFKTESAWVSEGGSIWHVSELDGWEFSPVYAPASN